MKTLFTAFFILFISQLSIKSQSINKTFTLERINPLISELGNLTIDNTINKISAQQNSTIYLLDSTIVKNRNDKFISKHINTYDGTGKQILSIAHTYDTIKNKWNETYKTESTYDSNGFLTLVLNYSWNTNNNSWKLSTKRENTNNNIGNPTIVLLYSFDSTNNIWKVTGKSEYSYDGNGLQTLMIFYSWDTFNNIWNNSSKSNSTYDGLGHLTHYVYNTWDATNNIWKEYTKYDYALDNNGNPSTSLFYTLDAVSNSLKINKKTEYNFDSNGNLTNLVNYTWDAANNLWSLNQINRYYYSLKNISSVNNPSSINFLAYPNPAKEEFQIKGLTEQSSFTLIDLNGKTLMNKNVINNEPISISSIAKGIYLIKLTTREGNFISKLTKK